LRGFSNLWKVPERERERKEILVKGFTLVAVFGIVAFV